MAVVGVDSIHTHRVILTFVARTIVNILLTVLSREPWCRKETVMVLIGTSLTSLTSDVIHLRTITYRTVLVLPGLNQLVTVTESVSHGFNQSETTPRLGTNCRVATLGRGGLYPPAVSYADLLQFRKTRTLKLLPESDNCQPPDYRTTQSGTAKSKEYLEL